MTSWPVGIVVGLLVAVVAWWFTRFQWGMPSLFVSLATGVAVFLLIAYVIPLVGRSLAVGKIERVERELESFRGETKAKDAVIQQHLKETDAKLSRLSKQLAPLQARDQALIQKRKELDQTVLPPPLPTQSREDALKVLQQFSR